MLNCDSCGLPLDDKVKAVTNATSWNLCRFCVNDATGELWPIENIISGMRDHYFMEQMGMNEEESQKAAEEAIKNMPAWKSL